MSWQTYLTSRDRLRANARPTRRGWRHYGGAIHAARQVLFHLGVLDAPAVPASRRVPFEQRMVAVAEPLRNAFVAYLHRKSATCKPKTVSSLATRLAGFGRFLAEIDPNLASLAELDRRRHIEPFLTSLTRMTNSVTGEPITVADQARRVHAVANFLAEITALPRYLPVDADRRLAQALADSPYRLAADALLLQRACGLRIGELLDLELDCVHGISGQGSWLKVPLGKLDSERMVPLDEETLTLLDRIVAPVRQAAYGLRKLRGKHLVDRPGRFRRYHVSPLAARTISALLTVRDQVIAPILGAQPRMGRKPAHWTSVDGDYERIRIDMQTLFNDLAIETPLAT